MAVLLSEVLTKAAGSYRGMLGLDQIKWSITNSRNYPSDGTPPMAAEALLIFSTSKQQTWLIATPNRLYCVLDDVRKAGLHINWSMARSRILKANGDIKIDVTARDETKRTGRVDIGPKQNWLFTKALFGKDDPEKRIRELITSAMLANPR